MPSLPVFNCKTSCSPGTQAPELEQRVGEQKEVSIIQGEVVSNQQPPTSQKHTDCGSRWGPAKDMGRAGGSTYWPTSHYLSGIGEIPVDCKLPNVMPIHKMGRNEDPREVRLVSVTLEPRKVVYQIIPSVLTWHIQDKQGSGPASMGQFIQIRSCFTNLISFCDKVTP